MDARKLSGRKATSNSPLVMKNVLLSERKLHFTLVIQ